MVQIAAKLDSTSLGDILQHVKEAPDITLLNLCRSGLTPSLAVELADFLESNSTITHVDLTGNRLGEHGVACLAMSLLKNSTVKNLVLAECGLKSETLKEWVSFFQSGINTTLCHLNLAHNQIDDDGAEALAAMLQAVKTQNMQFDLRKNQLSIKGLRILTDAMKAKTSVTAVNVEDNQDDDEPEAAVLQTRMDFYLRRNKAAIERETLCTTIGKIAMSSLELMNCRFKHIVLTISEADSLAAALRNNQSIVDLRLEDNALPEEGVRRILYALKTNRSVRTLFLVDNNIGEGGFRALSELLRVSTTGLRTVTVVNPMYLTPETGLEVMTRRTSSNLHYTLANYALLTSLSLANCGLDDQMVGVLVSGIAWSGRIEALDLQRNGFGNQSIHILVHMMQRCLRLYRLDLAGNSFTPEGLLPLFSSASSHLQLRVLLLGRFPSCDQRIMDEIVHAAEQSRTLVQLELTTTHKRTGTSERITSLNMHLRAEHGAEFEKEKQKRQEQVEMKQMWCRRRALIHQQAAALIKAALIKATFERHTTIARVDLEQDQVP
ncbi:Protein NLRC3 [Phytophthora citrophthora]|uniref:Protein NLRC3 n=1 Tax=Phytophthora citrophthora TaxID=4793 RepID=A0AAD9GLA4_9STRA|nr:Protein NLRC3 [Phytophthora citrophthora]